MTTLLYTNNWPAPLGALRLLAWLGLALAVFTGTPAYAQSADPAQLQVRIDQLESQLRDMTGRVEELSFQVKQLQERLQRFSEDTEFRFQDLNRGRAGAGSSASIASRNASPPPAETRVQPPSGSAGNYFANQPPAQGSSRFAVPPQNLGTLPGPLNISPVTSGGQQESSANLSGAPAGAGGANPAEAALGVPTDPQGAYDVAYAFILQRDFAGAELAFRNFLQDNPQHPLAGNAQYWLGESYFGRQQYREAADAFLKGYTQYKMSAKAPDSLLKLGMSLQALNQKDAACSTYAELDRKFPRAPRSVKQRAQTAMKDARC